MDNFVFNLVMVKINVLTLFVREIFIYGQTFSSKNINNAPKLFFTL